MKLQNISKKLLTGVVFTAALVSCSEDKMDEINKDHNHTTAVPAKMILTDVMTSTDLCQSRRRRAELHNKRHCGTFRGLQFGDLDRYVW